MRDVFTATYFTFTRQAVAEQSLGGLLSTMEKRIQYGNCRLRALLTEEAKDAVQRYLVLIASEVTSGKLDPARVNGRYIRPQTDEAMHH